VWVCEPQSVRTVVRISGLVRSAIETIRRPSQLSSPSVHSDFVGLSIEVMTMSPQIETSL
jgi:hypothetical protein